MTKVKEAIDALRQQLTRAAFAELERQVEELRQALVVQLPQIQTFLNEHLEVPERLEGVLEPLVRVNALAVRGVNRATSGIEPIGRAPQRGSAELDVLLDSVVQPYGMPMERGLPVGDDPPPRDYATRMRPAPEQRDIPVVVTLEFEVRRGAAGELVFDFQSAEVGDMDGALLRMLVRYRLRQ